MLGGSEGQCPQVLPLQAVLADGPLLPSWCGPDVHHLAVGVGSRDYRRMKKDGGGGGGSGGCVWGWWGACVRVCVCLCVCVCVGVSVWVGR